MEPVTSTGRGRGLGLVLVTAACAFQPVVGQDIRAVRGHVMDADTRNGVSSAWIQVPTAEHPLGVDSSGAFGVSLPAGVHTLLFHAFGYATLELKLEVRADTTISVALLREPIELAALEVEANRFSRRARALPWSVRLLDRSALLESAAPTPVDALKSRLVQLLPCRSGECVRLRGSLAEPLVCIDERYAPGGLNELRTYPMTSIYAIEVHERGRMIRAYTTWFMERLRAGQVRITSTIPIAGNSC